MKLNTGQYVYIPGIDPSDGFSQAVVLSQDEYKDYTLLAIRAIAKEGYPGGEKHRSRFFEGGYAISLDSSCWEVTEFINTHGKSLVEDYDGYYASLLSRGYVSAHAQAKHAVTADGTNWLQESGDGALWKIDRGGKVRSAESADKAFISPVIAVLNGAIVPSKDVPDPERRIGDEDCMEPILLPDDLFVGESYRRSLFASLA